MFFFFLEASEAESVAIFANFASITSFDVQIQKPFIRTPHKQAGSALICTYTGPSALEALRDALYKYSTTTTTTTIPGCYMIHETERI